MVRPRPLRLRRLRPDGPAALRDQRDHPAGQPGQHARPLRGHRQGRQADRLHRHASGGAAADRRPQPAGQGRQRPQHRVQERGQRLLQRQPRLRPDAQAGQDRVRRDQEDQVRARPHPSPAATAPPPRSRPPGPRRPSPRTSTPAVPGNPTSPPGPGRSPERARPSDVRPSSFGSPVSVGRSRTGSSGYRHDRPRRAAASPARAHPRRASSSSATDGSWPSCGTTKHSTWNTCPSSRARTPASATQSSPRR